MPPRPGLDTSRAVRNQGNKTTSYIPANPGRAVAMVPSLFSRQRLADPMRRVFNVRLRDVQMGDDPIPMLSRGVQQHPGVPEGFRLIPALNDRFGRPRT